MGLSSAGGVLEVRGIGFSGFLHDGASDRDSSGGSSTVSPMSSKKKQVFLLGAFQKALKMFSLIFIFPKGNLHYSSSTIYACIGCGKERMSKDDRNLLFRIRDRFCVKNYEINQIIELVHLDNDIFHNSSGFFDGSVSQLQDSTCRFQFP